MATGRSGNAGNASAFSVAKLFMALDTKSWDESLGMSGGWFFGVPAMQVFGEFWSKTGHGQELYSWQGPMSASNGV